MFISKKRQELIDTTDTREWTVEFLESLTDEDIINLDGYIKRLSMRIFQRQKACQRTKSKQPSK